MGTVNKRTFVPDETFILLEYHAELVAGEWPKWPMAYLGHLMKVDKRLQKLGQSRRSMYYRGHR